MDTNRSPLAGRPSRLRRAIGLTILSMLVVGVFAWPGLLLVRDLFDPAMSGPGIPARAVELHRDLARPLAEWAERRVASGAAAHAALYDVPTTEWPMFSAVFYLMGARAIEDAIARGELDPSALGDPTTHERAIVAARALLLDPSHHTWVRTHWGDDYLHRENAFFRSLLIAGLTADVAMTGNAASRAVLLDQTETLAAELDASPLGLLDDYPGECYPIDIVATIGFIRRADEVLGTDHRAFAERALRAFEGAQADRFGLPRFRVSLPSGAEVQPSRGIGTSWSLVFAPDLWPTRAAEWYATYDREFFRDHGWAVGFREYAEGTEPDWTFEIDAGPVFDGFGTAASAFGIGAARRNGRFDHAAMLSAELSAASWTLPNGELLLPRLASHAIDAPYLGETALFYFLTVQPAAGVSVIHGGHLPYSVWFALLVYVSAPLGVALLWLRFAREGRAARRGSLTAGSEGARAAST